MELISSATKMRKEDLEIYSSLNLMIYGAIFPWLHKGRSRKDIP